MLSKKSLSKYISNMDTLNSDKLDDLYSPKDYSSFNSINRTIGLNKNNRLIAKKVYSSIIGELNLDGRWVNASEPKYIHLIKNNMLSEIGENLYKDIPITFRGDGKFVVKPQDTVYTGSLNADENIINYIALNGSSANYVKIVQQDSPDLNGTWIGYWDAPEDSDSPILKQITIENGNIKGFDDINYKINFTNPKNFSVAFNSALYKGVLNDTNDIITWTPLEDTSNNTNGGIYPRGKGYWFRTIPFNLSYGSGIYNPSKVNYFELLDFYKEGIRENKLGIPDSGKLGWIDANIADTKTRQAYKDAYLEGRNQSVENLDENLYNKVKSYYNEGIREQKEGIWEGGKIYWVNNNESDNKYLFIFWYLQGRRDAINNTINFPARIVSSPSTEQSSENKTPASENKTPEVEDETVKTSVSEEKSNKILGLNKNVAIIGGIAILALGAILIIRKNK